MKTYLDLSNGERYNHQTSDNSTLDNFGFSTSNIYYHLTFQLCYETLKFAYLKNDCTTFLKWNPWVNVSFDFEKLGRDFLDKHLHLRKRDKEWEEGERARRRDLKSRRSRSPKHKAKNFSVSTEPPEVTFYKCRNNELG